MEERKKKPTNKKVTGVGSQVLKHTDSEEMSFYYIWIIELAKLKSWKPKYNNQT